MKNIILGTNVETGDPFSIPLAGAATKTLGVFGKKGSGKTYSAAVWVEQLLGNKVPVVVLDPVGRWWDLGVNADGQSPGFPIAVIGGRRGQIPLTPDMGGAIARYVAEKHVPTVVDLSDQSKGMWRRLVADFCDQLFAINETPVHVILEEAPEFIPQRFFGDQAVVFGAVDRLVRLGRNRGIGITLIGQRLQTTNKDSLSQVDMLTVMRLVDPHGRKAAREWVAAKGEEERADSFVEALTSLKTGTGYVWSPEWLETFVPVAFNKRITYHFDAERTSDTDIHLKVAQAVDADELQRLFSKFQEKPAEEKPTTKIKASAAVTRQIVELKRENASLKAALEASQAQSISNEEIGTRIQHAVAQATRDVQARLAQYSGFINQFVKAAQALMEVNGSSAEPARADSGFSPSYVQAFVEKQIGFFKMRTVTNILTILGENFSRFPDGMTSEEIALEANYDPRGGRFQDTLRLLVRRRVIVKRDDRYQLNTAHLK